MLYLVLLCRDGPAWYGVGLLIRWSYDHPGSNPGPGVFIINCLFLGHGCTLIQLGMRALLHILFQVSLE